MNQDQAISATTWVAAQTLTPAGIETGVFAQGKGEKVASVSSLADARLIAAAPDLLAIVVRIKTLGLCREQRGCPPSPLQAQIDAAIAKAKGEKNEGHKS